MNAEGIGAPVTGSRGVRFVAVVSVVVGVLGALATGRVAFAVAVAASAALAFGTMAVALRRGRAAVAAGELTRAGAVAGGLLVVRLLGLAALMVIATVVPTVLDLWGVVAGMIAADATLLITEGFGRPKVA